MDTVRFLYLLERYEGGAATPAEEARLLAFFADPASRGEIGDLLTRALAATPSGKASDPARWQPVIDRILGREQEPARIIPIRKGWGRGARRITAAASILLVAAALALFTILKPHPEKSLSNPKIVVDIAPGGNKAILTLSNGQKIILDSAANGQLAQQGNARVQKIANGQLAYTVFPAKPTVILYNTLTTPRGGQYQLVLPDGSKVWLNAASGITYPTAFTGKERKVTITGEAYFEVVHNARMPFKVKAGNQTIEDIGTHFDINAYEDEPAMKVSLLEGSVKVVSQAGTTRSLTPGQQAIINSTGVTRIDDKADMEEVMAWKNGQFKFASADIHAVMRQIARWYNIDLEYEKPVTETFYVKTSRNTPLSTVLRILETTGGVHFAIDGKMIIVSP
jgi:transmembrane sensor